MTDEEWAEYHRRLKLRETRRREVVAQLGWSSYPGWGRSRRTQYQRTYPQFGGQVQPSVAHHGSVR